MTGRLVRETRVKKLSDDSLTDSLGMSIHDDLEPGFMKLL